MIDNYCQFHFHTDYSNKTLTDSPNKFKHYCERAVELGQTTLTTVEHGYLGDVLDKYDLANKYNLKLIVGAEFYITVNRFEKVRDNFHIIILAKKQDGYREINRLISESSKEESSYYRDRIDIELIKTLNPNDFMITTACVGGILKSKEVFKAVHNHFKTNLFIEVQSHDDDIQKKFNHFGVQVAKQLGLKLIHANDSHYIHPEDAKLRDVLLRGRGLYYSEESNFILDYPTIDTIRERYKQQGVLTHEQIEEALETSNIINDFEGFYRDKTTIKMPSLFKGESHETKMKRFKRVINNEFINELPRIRNNFKNNKCSYDEKDYIKEILYETDIIDQTDMEDYYLLNYYINKDAIENRGGQLSPTARGSASSFILNFLYRFTNIDRVSSKVKLYSERFMTVDRIKAGSLPDIDMNVSDQKPFVDSAKNLLGEHAVYPMISFITLQFKSSFRIVCKAYNKDKHLVDSMADKFDDTDEEKFNNAYEKYVQTEEWKDILIYSKRLVDVIVSSKHHACAYLLLSDDIREEFGVVRTDKGVEVCVVDSNVANDWLYLKNDWLIVDVVRIINAVYPKLGMAIPTVEELGELVNNNEKVWDLYDRGLTKTLNQVGSDFSVDLVEDYKPRTVEELSAFVACIRPGFASDRSKFIGREDFSYGIKELDSLLQDSYNFMIYQENVMSVLAYAGIPNTRTYEIIKAISKKKLKVIQEAEKEFINGFVKKNGDEEIAKKVWRIIYDSSRYSFNASHSIAMSNDSLYCAYPKAYYPEVYFPTVMQLYVDKDKDERDKLKGLINELPSFGMKFEHPKYGKASNEYIYDDSTRSIYASLKGYKFINDKVATEVNKLYNELQPTNIIDLFINSLEDTTLTKTHIETLLKMNFFAPICEHNKKMLDMYTIFREGLKGFELNQSEEDLRELYDKLNGIPTEQDQLKLKEKVIKAIIKNGVKFSKGVKSHVERRLALQMIWEILPNEKFPLAEQLKFIYVLSGEINYPMDCKHSLGLLVEVSGDYRNKRCTIYRPKDNSLEVLYIDERLLKSLEVEEFNFIETIEVEQRQVRIPQIQDNGEKKWVDIEGKFKMHLTKFNKVNIN